MPPPPSSSKTKSSLRQQQKQKPLDKRALVVMVLLAFQFGLQPILTKLFTPPSVCKSTVILCQEVVKFGLAFFMLYISGDCKSALSGWSMSTWISVAGIPASLYAIQNLAALLAYQNLDALTFNVLNQTKTLSAALCCYLVMGKRQSSYQIVALLLLLSSALIMERIITLDWLLEYLGMVASNNNDNDAQQSLESDDSTQDVSMLLQQQQRHWTHGVAPVLFASFLSGLAGALSQKNLQSSSSSSSSSGGTGGRNPFLFSMELCAASSLILVLSLLVSPDGKVIASQGGLWGKDWNATIFIPILTNAIGGILVGLVTKYAGSVRKGFALIFGIFLSGLWQSEQVSNEQICGGILAAVSLWMHAVNPPSSSSSSSSSTMTRTTGTITAKKKTV